MKIISLIFLFLSIHISVLPQNKLQTLWTILDNGDTSSLAGFFNNWYEESIPITDIEISNISPLLKNTYDIFECIYKPFPVSYTHLRAHETVLDLVCRLLLEKKKTPTKIHITDLHISPLH